AKTVHDLGLDVGVYENPLGRDAHLTSMAIATLDHGLDHLVEFGTAIDDRRGGPAMLQRTARSGCQLAAQVLTDARRAAETEKAHLRIDRQPLCEPVVIGQKGLAP